MGNMFLLENISKTLAAQGKTLQIKNGSFLRNLNSSEMYQQLGDKLLTEISMFKNELYPAMKFFKTSLENALSIRKPESGLIQHKMFSLPVCVSPIVATEKITPTLNRYVPRTLIKTYDSMVNVDEVEDLKSLFISENIPATSGLAVILENMTNEEIKDFISTYCTILYDNGSEEVYKGRKSYREFGRTSISALINLDKVCLLWGFLKNRLVNGGGSSNVSRENEIEILKVALEEIDSIIAVGVGAYESFIKEKVVVFDDPNRDGNINSIYVVDAVLGELIEKASTDPWTAMFGSHSEIVNLFREEAPMSRTVEDILLNEQEYIRYYNRVQEINSVKEQEVFVQSIRKQILNYGKETFSTFMTPEMMSYTSCRHYGDFTDKVIAYLRTVSDHDLISDSAMVSATIIGKILFDKTYFGVFLDSQSEVEDVVSNFDIKEESETTLWVINFLSRFLVESLEIVNG